MCLGLKLSMPLRWTELWHRYRNVTLYTCRSEHLPKGKIVKKKAQKSSEENNLRNFISETFTIYMKTYAVHWNYQGSKFYGVHHMTEEQYKELAEAIDVMAERLRAVGHKAPVSLEQIVKNSSLKEFQDIAGDKSVKELGNAHRALSKLAKEYAEAADEAGELFTHDMFVARIGIHDKFAWMLESFQA